MKVYGTKEGKLYIKPEELFTQPKVKSIIKKVRSHFKNKSLKFRCLECSKLVYPDNYNCSWCNSDKLERVIFISNTGNKILYKNLSGNILSLDKQHYLKILI